MRFVDHTNHSPITKNVRQSGTGISQTDRIFFKANMKGAPETHLAGELAET
jgi:hypothetical protein